MDLGVTQVNPDSVSDDGEISLLDVASFVLRRRRLILLATFVGALFGLVSALRSTLDYTATFSFLPHAGEQGVVSGVAGLASQFGLSVPRTNSAERSPAFYQDLITSREILNGMVRSGVEVVTATGVTNVDLAEHFRIDGETPEEQSALTRRRLAESVLEVSFSPATSVVTVGVRTDEPGLSAAVGRRLLDLISAFDLETRQSQASAERGFAEERLEQLQGEFLTAESSLESFLVENRQFTNSPQLTFEHDRLVRQVTMRQELMTAMAQAYEQARIDEVRNTSVITVIDQPEVPTLPNPRGRLVTQVMGVILGIMVGFGLAFIQELGERVKNAESEAYRKFRQILKDIGWDLFGLRRSGRPDPSSTDGR